jgi:hypothetical protein
MSVSAQRVLRAGLAGCCVLLLSGCAGATTTIFNAQFTSDSVGASPSPAQTVGTVAVQAGAGSVLVATPPPGAIGNWVKISHPTRFTPETGLQGKFTDLHGNGTYILLAALFIPTGCEVVTLQFESWLGSSYPSFLHLDFMPNNTVRIDDRSTTFGTFQRDKYFTVLVRLDVGSPVTRVHMQLFGTGASGDLDYNVLSIFGSLPQQFAAVRFWMGYQWVGAFKVDDITVSYTEPQATATLEGDEDVELASAGPP